MQNFETNFIWTMASFVFPAPIESEIQVFIFLIKQTYTENGSLPICDIVRGRPDLDKNGHTDGRPNRWTWLYRRSC